MDRRQPPGGRPAFDTITDVRVAAVSATWASASNRRSPRLEVVGADGADRGMTYRIRR